MSFDFLEKTLQETSLLTPKLLSVWKNGIKDLEKPLHLLNRDGSDAFHHCDIFKTAREILEQLPVDKDKFWSNFQLTKISYQSVKHGQ